MVHHKADAGPAGAERSEEVPTAGPAVADPEEGASLDRKRELSGCARWPLWMRLLSSEGELVMGRCKATNLCVHCQRCYVRETVEALVLDSMEVAPTCWVVLTAREHLTRADLRRHFDSMRQSLKRRGWRVEWFVQVEFQRRGAIHANLLVKGCAGREAAFGEDLFDLWQKRPGVTAVREAQYVGEIGAAVAVAKYCGKMLGHGLKQEQAPPLGWRGHRTSHTRGYFAAGTPTARARARESLAYKRALAIALASGLDAHDAELGVRQAQELAARTTWVLANERGARLSKLTPRPAPLAELLQRRIAAGATWDIVDLARWVQRDLAGAATSAARRGRATPRRGP